MTTEARALPPRSVVATGDRVWIKREAATSPRSPFYETWWIEATTYAIQTGDRDIQRFLDTGEARVLRVGDEVPG